MAKAVHWTIPFQSVKGINYEIRIYDDYTGSVPAAWPVTLQAGETPITTQEDASDDFFTPVRPSTGTISVIDPDGTLMEQLIPANNIARPVRLVSIDRTTTPATETIEWQGFLSCEAYQQDYTAIAQELQLSIISVLEAMKSVEMDVETSNVCKVREILSDLITCLHDEVGITMLTNVHYSYVAKDFMDKYIDTTVLYELKEQCNEDKVKYIIKGITCYDMLSNLCHYMGWVARELGQHLYLCRITDEIKMRNQLVTDLEEDTGSVSYNTITPVAMSALTYRGTSHNKSISQGARFVEIIASLKEYELNMSIPDYPYGQQQETTCNCWKGSSYPTFGYLYAISSKQTEAYNNISFNYKSFEYNEYYTGGTRWQNVVDTTLDELISGTIDTEEEGGRKKNSFFNTLMQYGDLWSNWYEGTQIGEYCHLIFAEHQVGAFFARIEWTEQQSQTHNVEDGLLLSGVFLGNVGTLFNETGPIVSFRNILHSMFDSGYINIQSDMYTFNAALSNTNQSGLGMVEDATSSNLMRIAVRCGSKYFNGTNWSTTPATITVSIEDGKIKKSWTSAIDTEEVDGLLIPINSKIVGEVSIDIYPQGYGYFLKSFDVSYVPLRHNLQNDRTENHYSMQLAEKFSDEIALDLNFASDMNNKPSPSIVHNDATGSNTLKKMAYYTTTQGTSEQRRPEVDLLNRVSAYYGQTRRTIELETEHPTQAALPLLTITGYDNRKYIPLYEERDWQQDTSKLTCYETPDGDS